jgi:hypothetical protein
MGGNVSPIARQIGSMLGLGAARRMARRPSCSTSTISVEGLDISTMTRRRA